MGTRCNRPFAAIQQAIFDCQVRTGSYPSRWRAIERKSQNSRSLMTRRFLFYENRMAAINRKELSPAQLYTIDLYRP